MFMITIKSHEMAPRTITSIFPQPYSDFYIVFVFKDNYFEEALKMRNILEEFKGNYGIHPPTILGVREHVFTGR